MLKTLNQAWLKYRLKNQEYQFLFDAPPDQDVVCFDCETSGLDPRKDSIVSLSAIKIRGAEILTSQSLSLKFKQQQVINPESIVIHGLRNMDVEAGLEPADAIRQFVEFIGSRPLVGYYLEFDMAMVNGLIKPWLGISLPNQQIEVSQLYHKQFYQDWLQPEHEVFDLSFKTILAKLNLPSLGQHDAFNDALMTAMIYVKLNEMRKD
ncbi:3'-5' exonuclease [Thiomicrospira microaerophila]|uniref:3'-5' exonuclease n=1 Tax=Thiomicrospira microaerophila TaxID=406020 RepID=UPI00200BC64B|nr:3'-5' exonuclease [Thiomicrospira microaerophila]UQB43441.1 3'-5' exonuclease [Thiomicrospira microaerophila]